MSRSPVIYVAHGSPTLAVDEEKAAPLRTWGRELAAPKAVLWISAHFEARPVAMSAPRGAPLVYDFYGFPAPLYAVRYDAPGAPDLAARLESLLGGERSVDVAESRGLDHGAWVPALHLFPDATVPMIQLSLPSRDARELFELGQRLAPLRDEGILIAGSGNIVHNLRRVDWNESNPPEGWASEFDAWAADAVARLDVDALMDWERAPGARLAHPTSDHLSPLFVAMGAALEGKTPEVHFPLEGWEFGNISRRSIQLG